MKKELFVDVAVVIGEDIYFTAVNECCLYKYSVCTDEISLEKELPITSASVKKFVSMISYNSKIWMIPLNEKYFWVYDIKLKTIKYLEIPKECVNSRENAIFRRAVQNNEYIWLIPNYADCILQINMKEEEYKILDVWPEGVEVKKDKPNFKSASYYNGKLYLFRDNCNANIIFDVNDGSMQIWDLPVEGEFGLVQDGKVIIAPVKNGNTIRIFSLKKNSSCLEKELVVSEDIWGEEKTYAFWYMISIENKVFILPHEANALLILNMTELNTKSVMLNNSRYKNLFENSYFAIVDIIKVCNKVVIFSYEGNQLVVLNDDDKIEKIILLSIPDNLCGNELKNFIDGVVLKKKALWKNEKNLACNKEYEQESVGKVIYSSLIKENKKDEL